MWLWNKSNHKSGSRRQIQIKEVRDGILVLPKKQHCLVIETSALNFELKSEAEQDVIIDSFRNFLNALPGSIQILVRVREVDIDRYLDMFAKNREKESQRVYKNQISQYCDFIQKLVRGNKILSRRFYLVIPYTHKSGKNDFNLIREQFNLNRDIVIRGLEKLGMKSKVLDSLEVLNLFYSFYNPVEAKLQPLSKEALSALFEPNYV